MERKKLFQLVEYLKKEVDKEINDRLPRKVGVMAKKIFTQNFINISNKKENDPNISYTKQLKQIIVVLGGSENAIYEYDT